jgi:hypothetical protein
MSAALQQGPLPKVHLQNMHIFVLLILMFALGHRPANFFESNQQLARLRFDAVDAKELGWTKGNRTGQAAGV